MLWVHRLLWFWVEVVHLKRHQSRNKHWWNATFTIYICIPFRCGFHNCIMQTAATQKSISCIKRFIWFLSRIVRGEQSDWKRRGYIHLLLLRISFSLLRSLVSFVPQYEQIYQFPVKTGCPVSINRIYIESFPLGINSTFDSIFLSFKLWCYKPPRNCCTICDLLYYFLLFDKVEKIDL